VGQEGITIVVSFAQLRHSCEEYVSWGQKRNAPTPAPSSIRTESTAIHSSPSQL